MMNTAHQREQLISEPLTPLLDTLAESPIVGEPCLPKGFRWRRRTHEVREVVEKWRDTGPCTHGSGERYVRRHCYRLNMANGEQWRVYFQRSSQGRLSKRRWHLYSITSP